MITLTKEAIVAGAPAVREENAEKYLSFLNSKLGTTLDNHNRAAAFLSQIVYESEWLSRVEEDLNYSAKTLLRLFPSHFSSMAVATRYAHHPEMIANRIYANRYGNGPESSGDGWRYRGSGLIQLTFKDNHLAFSKAINFEGDIGDYLRTPEGAVVSAVWFWHTHKLDNAADQQKIGRISIIVNGGTTGLVERGVLFRAYQKVLAT